MGALLEQYFQNVVVDKIDETVAKHCQELKNNLEAVVVDKIDKTVAKHCQGIMNNLEAECREIKSKIKRLSVEIENLKKQASGSGKKSETTKKQTSAQYPRAKKPVAKKAPAKKSARK